MGKGRRTELAIGGMSCGHCAAAVETALRGVQGAHEVQVELDRGRATLELDERTPVADLIRAVEVAGYRAEPAGS